MAKGKSFKSVSIIFIFFTLILAGLHAMPPRLLALAPYDTLATGPINSDKWGAYELVRVIDSGNLRMSLRSSVDTTGPLANNLGFANPGAIHSMGALITPIGYGTGNGAGVIAAMGGTFYNDGTSSTDCRGNVLGQVGVSTNGSGPLAGFWVVARFTGLSCETSEVVSSGGFTATAVVTGTAYPAGVDWDGTKFTFTFNGETHEYTPSTTRNAPNSPFKNIVTRILNNAGKDAAITATFDNVFVNGDLYDDFSGTRIDGTKWTTYEVARAVKNAEGHLVLRVRNTADSPSGSVIALPATNPENVVAMQAKVTPRVITSVPGIPTAVRVGGIFFNDGTAGGGIMGDIGAGTSIVPAGSGSGFKGFWRVVRYKSATDATAFDVLAQGFLPGTLAADTEYRLFAGWDGTEFTFRVDDETATWTKPATLAVNSAKSPVKQFDALIGAGHANAEVVAYFRDVAVEYAIPMGDKFPIANTTAHELGVSAATDGNRYLVGIETHENATSNVSYVTARMVDSTGALYGNLITTGRTGGMPRVTFGGNKYLMVWEDQGPSKEVSLPSRIYGALVSTSGVAETPFSIGPVAPPAQRIGIQCTAFDGVNYLVVWGDGTGIYGQRVSRTGALTGKVIVIYTGQANDPSIAFDGTNYLVAWHVGSGVYGRFVTRAGKAAAKSFVIDGTSYDSTGDVLLVYDGTRYVVTIPDLLDAATNRSGHYIRTVSRAAVVSAMRKELYQGEIFKICSIVGFDGTNYLAVCGQVVDSAAAFIVNAKGRLFDRNLNPVTNWVGIFGTRNGMVPVGPVPVWNKAKSTYLAVATRAVYTDNPPAGQDNFTYGDVGARFLSPSLKEGLTVYVEGNGAGSVRSAPVGINCGNGATQCSWPFGPFQKIALAPRKAQGSVFAGWSGACSGVAACIVTMEHEKSVVATFTKDPTIAVNPGSKAFPVTRVGKQAKAVFVVANTAAKGTADLVLGTVAFTAATTEFSLNGANCSGKTLKTGKSCTFTVTFNPTSPGSGKTATIAIPSNDPARQSTPKTVTVTGTGK